MNKKYIQDRLKTLPEETKIKMALETARNGLSIEKDVIPILINVASVAEDAAKLFLDNYKYLS